jgi:hypothetical protein
LLEYSPERRKSARSRFMLAQSFIYESMPWSKLLPCEVMKAAYRDRKASAWEAYAGPSELAMISSLLPCLGSSIAILAMA